MSEFAGQKFLVTGASGFIGAHLCGRLLAGGAEVHGVFRSKPLPGLNVHWWHVDLAETDAVERVLKEIKPDVIFHLASEVTGGREPRLVLPTFRSNLASTVNLLSGARQIGCRRFILTGSLEEPEFSEPQGVPCSPYAVAKWAGTAYARMFHALYDLDVVVLRLFMVYGPAQRDLTKLIPYVILSLLKGEAPKLGSGRRDVDWIYVEDVVEGLVAAGRAENVQGRTIDVGSGELASIHTVVDRIFALMNSKFEPGYGTLPDRAREPVRAADVAASRLALGWEPKISLETGLRRTVDWYSRHMPGYPG